MHASLLSLLALALPSLASPVLRRQSACPSNSGDAPYTVDCGTLAAAVNCPNGIKGRSGGVVLLVHGTGSTGEESWGNGPYVEILPDRADVDVCWVTLPNRALDDMQVSAEYVAYNIGALASQSATGKVAIIGHSQGAGCNPQWALDFWPSYRPLVSDYVALAGDFHGTAEGPLLCQPEEGGCAPSVWQQSVGSKYLAAQNSKAGQALVTTTSIYTITDDVIQPELTPSVATSNLPDAAVYALQDLSVCGPLHVADHFSMIVDPAAFNLAVDALTHDGPADASRLNKAACTYLVDNVLIEDYQGIPALVRGIFNDIVAVGTGSHTPAEPPLMSYVCARGDAPAADCAA